MIVALAMIGSSHASSPHDLVFMEPWDTPGLTMSYSSSDPGNPDKPCLEGKGLERCRFEYNRAIIRGDFGLAVTLLTAYSSSLGDVCPAPGNSDAECRGVWNKTYHEMARLDVNAERYSWRTALVKAMLGCRLPAGTHRFARDRVPEALKGSECAASIVDAAKLLPPDFDLAVVLGAKTYSE
jgi:hypothetical protein